MTSNTNTIFLQKVAPPKFIALQISKIQITSKTNTNEPEQQNVVQKMTESKMEDDSSVEPPKENRKKSKKVEKTRKNQEESTEPPKEANSADNSTNNDPKSTSQNMVEESEV